MCVGLVNHAIAAEPSRWLTYGVKGKSKHKKGAALVLERTGVLAQASGQRQGETTRERDVPGQVPPEAQRILAWMRKQPLTWFTDRGLDQPSIERCGVFSNGDPYLTFVKGTACCRLWERRESMRAEAGRFGDGPSLSRDELLRFEQIAHKVCAFLGLRLSVPPGESQGKAVRPRGQARTGCSRGLP